MAEWLEPIVQEFRGDASNLLREEKKVEGSYDSLGKKSRETSDGLGKDTKDSEKAFTEFDRLLRSKLKDGETALDGFKRELDDTRSKVANLRADLQKSSGQDSLGIFQDLKKAEADLKSLENIGDEILPGFKKNMNKTGQEGGKQLAQSVDKGFEGAFAGIPWMPVIIGGLVAASPLIIGMLGSAVSTAVGTVGIIGGVVGAAHDPRVKGAFEGLLGEIKTIFFDATSVFVGPVLAGIHDIEGMFASAAPGLKTMFEDLANAARPLLDGFGQFVVQMLPGLESGMKGIEPLILEFAKLLPWLGEKVGEMFDAFGKGGAGSRLALEALIGVLGGALVMVGKLFEYSSKFFLWFDQQMGNLLSVGSGVMRFLGNVPGPLGDVANKNADALANLRDNLRRTIKDAQDLGTTSNGVAVANENMINTNNSLGTSLRITAADMEALVQAQDDWIGKTQSVDDTLLSMHQALSTFNQELHRGKQAWDLNRQAGQQNQSALNQAVHGVTAYYDALKALHPLTRQQVQDEIDSLTKLYDQAKAAGASATNIGGLADQIKLLQQRLNELNHTTVVFSVHGVMTGVSPSKAVKGVFAEGGIAHADAGMVSGVLPPRNPGTLMVLAGEARTHGEVFMPLAGISQQRAMDLAQVAGDAYGFDVVPRGRAYAYAAGGGQTLCIHNHVILDGKEIHTNQIKHAQRYKLRTGTTGLT